MTEEQLAKIETRLNATSRQGDGSQPWEFGLLSEEIYCGNVIVAEVYALGDQEFMLHAPQDMRDLLAYVRQLRAKLLEAAALLSDLDREIGGESPHVGDARDMARELRTLLGEQRDR